MNSRNSRAYQKGRIDAASGVNKPPFGGHIFQTSRGAKESNDERQSYELGHAREKLHEARKK